MDENGNSYSPNRDEDFGFCRDLLRVLPELRKLVSGDKFRLQVSSLLTIMFIFLGCS